MAAKVQPVIPPPPPVHLETIYEESGSSLTSSMVDIYHQSRNHQKLAPFNSNQSAHGLISARSIPSVDVHRRKRINESQQKPPIEVRYRDGTKRYIQPALTTTPMIVNRRKYSHSSRHDSSSSSTKSTTKYRQIFNITPKKKKKLPEKSKVILTIITAEDLTQAGITQSSISSPDDSDTLALTKSNSNSSLDTLKTVKDISLKETITEPKERLPKKTIPPVIQTVKPVIDVSMSNHRFPTAPRHHSHHQQQLRHPLQINTIRSQSLPPSQSYFISSTQPMYTSNQLPSTTVVLPTQKKTTFPSLQITLSGDENERNSSSKINLPNISTSSLKDTNEVTNSEHKQSIRPSATTLSSSGSRSAFRPFLKPTPFNSQPQISSNINARSQISTHQMLQNLSQQQQQQQIVPSSHPHSQQYSHTIGFALQSSGFLHDHGSITLDASKQTVDSLLSNQILSDKLMNSTLQMRALNYPQQSVMSMVDNSFNKSNISKDQNSNIKNPLVTVDPTLQWHSITSKSLYEVPRLSKKYSDTPLRIVLPEGTPTHNQKLLHKHDIALERRLLDAGLSPETIALYERILEVADIRHMARKQPPEGIDQYQNKSLLSVVKY